MQLVVQYAGCMESVVAGRGIGLGMPNMGLGNGPAVLMSPKTTRHGPKTAKDGYEEGVVDGKWGGVGWQNLGNLVRGQTSHFSHARRHLYTSEADKFLKCMSFPSQHWNQTALYRPIMWW